MKVNGHVYNYMLLFTHLTVAQQLDKKQQYLIILKHYYWRWHKSVSTCSYSNIAHIELELVLTCEFQRISQKQNLVLGRI
jgi:hypothetical protein